MPALMRLQRLLAGERGPWLLGLLAVAISLPAVRLGFQADDYILRWKVEHGAQPWRLFHLTPEMLREGRETGALAWWTSPQLAGEFFRPISSLMHTLELRLWPETAWPMLVINVLLYGACAAIATHLYQRLCKTGSAAGVASIAAVMFAIDDAHAQSVGWISGRNTVLALFGSLSALAFHVHARERERASSKYAIGSTLCVALALGAAEAGVWALSFLIAYALVLEDAKGLAARLGTIAPQLGIGAVWAGCYVVFGFGLHGSSLYRSLSSPLTALTQGVLDLPLFITSSLGPSLIGFAVLVPENTARLIATPIAAVLLWLALPSLKSSRECRFFALAALLCLAPLMMTVASDRVLMGASFATFGWIGTAIAQRETARARWTGRVLLLFHVVLALPLYVPMLSTVHRFENGRRALAAEAVPGKDVVLIASPVELLPNYVGAALQRASNPPPSPRSVHQLYAGGSELWLERPSATALDVTATRGWGYAPVERIFCAEEDMPKLGDVVRLERMTARILKVNERGMPTQVRFELPTVLESEERVWLVWKGDRPVRFTPPAIGGSLRIAPLDLFTALPP